MRLLVLFGCWVIASPLLGEEASIDVDQFRLETILGAQAKATPGTTAPNGQKSVEVVVSKPGLEFWSVELRAAGQKFESGKTYEIKFEAKASPAQFIYVVPEKVNGNQTSVAEGTTLRIPEDWTECTVVFHVTDTADPGRLTLSNLATNPATFGFDNFRVSVR
jgi:Carbohydrate binding domain